MRGEARDLREHQGEHLERAQEVREGSGRRRQDGGLGACNYEVRPRKGVDFVYRLSPNFTRSTTGITPKR